MSDQKYGPANMPVDDFKPGYHGPKCLGGPEPHPECLPDRVSWFEGPEHAQDLAEGRDVNQTGKANAERGMHPCIKTDSKPPLPGLKKDTGKPSWTLLPFKALSLVVDVLTFGAAEYERDNWLHVKPEYRYEDALFRHYAAWKLGERLDPKSGLPHLAHLACNALFILALKEGTDP